MLVGNDGVAVGPGVGGFGTRDAECSPLTSPGRRRDRAIVAETARIDGPFRVELGMAI
jgi:hypothetical protein